MEAASHLQIILRDWRRVLSLRSAGLLYEVWLVDLRRLHGEFFWTYNITLYHFDESIIANANVYMLPRRCNMRLDLLEPNMWGRITRSIHHCRGDTSTYPLPALLMINHCWSAAWPLITLYLSISVQGRGKGGEESGTFPQRRRALSACEQICLPLSFGGGVVARDKSSATVSLSVRHSAQVAG